MKTYHVDTNLILRFLTGAPEGHAKLAAEFFQHAEDGKHLIQISPIVVSEVVFVLTGKIYGCSRVDVAEQLLQFLSNPSFNVLEFEAMVKTLELFRTHTIDFADAYLAATAQLSGVAVATFDRDFKKVKGLDALILGKK